MATTDYIVYGTWVGMTVTNISLTLDASDPFVAWQSGVVDNRTLVAVDYLVRPNLGCTAATPGGDGCAYVYVCPWMHDGTSWVPAGNFGTATPPTTSEGTASVSDPNSMRGPIALPYKVVSQPMQGLISIASVCGGVVPQGWSLAMRFNGASAGSTLAAATSTCSYIPIFYDNA